MDGNTAKRRMDGEATTVSQPDLLIQFIGTFVDCDPTVGTITFRSRNVPADQLEGFGRFAEKHIRAKTQVLVLVYDLNDFEDYHQQIAVQLKAQRPEA